MSYVYWLISDMDFNLCPISDWFRRAFSANSIQCYFDKSQQSNGYRQGSWFVKGGFMISTVVVPSVGEGASDNWLAVSLVLSKCFERIFNLANIQLWGNFWFLIFERAASSQPCTLEMLWRNSKTWWTLQTKMRHRRWSVLVRGRQSLVTCLKLCHLRPDEERGAKEFPRRNWVLRPQQAWPGRQPRRQRGSRRRATQWIILWCASFGIMWWKTLKDDLFSNYGAGGYDR